MPDTTKTQQTWRFSPVDSWFFRESRPHDRAGGTELVSLFPPLARTLAGAVRTFIGDSLGVDWWAFAREKDHPLRKRIGFGNDLGPLSFSGPWLCKGDKRLYPLPLSILTKILVEQPSHNQAQGQRMQKIAFFPLTLGDPVETDLGRIRFPRIPGNAAGYKQRARCWVSAEGFSDILAGKMPESDAVVVAGDLYEEEFRLGIARDNIARTAEKGLLYQTRHLRLGRDVSVEVDVMGGPEPFLPSGLMRLGGEGRMAHVEIIDHRGALPEPPTKLEGREIMLHALTPVKFGKAKAATTESKIPFGIPADFTAKQEGGVTVFCGKINEI
ncbi:MAG: hypothetical protein KJO08_00245, partial [Gammaproteobacteria bacterium]|nr:hypothetical protein [Gammaproteobacteria bacterium]